MSTLKKVAISSIRENPTSLRAVNKESEQYIGLVDSIKNQGFLGAITVRAHVDPENGNPTGDYELIDGLHRFNAAKDAGLTEINVDIQTMNEEAFLEAQVLTNIHRVETKPVEYTKHLRRMMALNPTLTIGTLAAKLAKSASWVSDRLSLKKIESETIQQLIDKGEIPLCSAFALAKLPAEEQANFTDRAMTLPANQFVKAVDERLKELRDAARKGEDAKPEEFVPTIHMQKLSDVKAELSDAKIAGELIAKTGANTAAAGFALALQWVCHIDPISVEAQKAAYDARIAAKNAEKEKLKAERLAKESARKEAAAAAAVAAADEAKKALGSLT